MKFKKYEICFLVAILIGYFQLIFGYEMHAICGFLILISFLLLGILTILIENKE
jgi:hypothetical protein